MITTFQVNYEGKRVLVTYFEKTSGLPFATKRNFGERLETKHPNVKVYVNLLYKTKMYY